MRKKREVKEARAKYATKRAKIAVEIDLAQLAREPIIVRRNGEFIGAVISTEEYYSFQIWQKNRKPKEDFPAEWYAEQAAFKKMLPELLKTCQGKFVAVYQGQVIDNDDKPGELISRVEQKYGNVPIYYGEVLEKPRVYRIPSAWIARR